MSIHRNYIKTDMSAFVVTSGSTVAYFDAHWEAAGYATWLRGLGRTSTVGEV